MDGEGNSTIDTGVGFLDHMLTLLAAHGRFDLEVSCKGDLQVDVHHTVEDVGIVLGKAMAEALGQRTSIRRYGSCIIPMDEALALVSMDMGMRAFLAYDVPFSTDRVGEMDTEMFEEFFRALSQQAGITLHIKLMYGKNNHHIAEAVFKAFARALREATSIDETIKGVLSSKGVF
jgi:imidazoleglycerol-phosphate dehydratase